MTEKAKEAYNEMAKKMDDRDVYYKKLRQYFINHGEIPDAEPPKDINHHRESFEAYKKDRFKSWRVQPKVVKRIKKAAVKAAKAKGLEKLTEEAQSGDNK